MIPSVTWTQQNLFELYEKMLQYSSFGEDEREKGCALYVRACLRFTERDAQSAADELAKLMPAAENPAWFASLVGSLPQRSYQDQAVAYCIGQIKAGNKHRWGKALSMMPYDAWAGPLEGIADQISPKRLSGLFSPSSVTNITLPEGILMQLSKGIDGEDDSLKEWCATALGLATPPGTPYHEKALAFFRGLVKKHIDDDLWVGRDEALAALLVDDSDPLLAEKATTLYQRDVDAADFPQEVVVLLR